jgi:hypothetical protein
MIILDGNTSVQRDREALDALRGQKVLIVLRGTGEAISTLARRVADRTANFDWAETVWVTEPAVLNGSGLFPNGADCAIAVGMDGESHASLRITAGAFAIDRAIDLARRA